MRLTVVVADDEPSLRAMLRMLLERDGRFEVIAEASDGEDALEQIDRHDPDLLLLDLAMPVLDGLQVLERLGGRERPRVIVLTGFAERGVDETARQLGAARVLVKGADIAEITASLIE